MSIQLALVDAANNCARQNARVVITIRSGVQFEGTLEKSNAGFHTMSSVMLYTKIGGWVAVALDEIVAVESKR